MFTRLTFPLDTFEECDSEHAAKTVALAVLVARSNIQC